MMPEITARKRLRKKVLDRWENEGGSLCDTSPEPSAKLSSACDPDGAAGDDPQDRPSAADHRSGKKK